MSKHLNKFITKNDLRWQEKINKFMHVLVTSQILGRYIFLEFRKNKTFQKSFFKISEKKSHMS